MTDLYWPLETIGRPAYPVREGYAMTHQRPVMTRRWPLSTTQIVYARTAPAEVPVEFALADADMAFALGWLVHEAAWGTAWFWMPLKGAGAIELTEVQVVSESITEALRGPKHGRLSLRVLTRRSMVVDEDEWALMLLLAEE